jgi:hypothetical protein
MKALLERMRQLSPWVTFLALAITGVLLGVQFISLIDDMLHLPQNRTAVGLWNLLGKSNVQGLLLLAIAVILAVRRFEPPKRSRRPRRTE